MKFKGNIYAIVTGFFAAALILAVFVIYPSQKSIAEGGQSILSIKEKTALLERQEQEIKKFNKNYRDYRPNLTAFEEISVDPEQPVNFIKFLEDIAGLSGISDFSININAPQAREGELSASFAVSVKGSFLEILNFSRRLEMGPYLVKITNVAITKFEEKEPDTLTGQLAASFFVKVQ